MNTKLTNLRLYLTLSSLIYAFLFPQYSWAYFNAQEEAILTINYSTTDMDNNTQGVSLTIIQGHTLLQINNPETPSSAIQGPTCPVPAKKFVVITAYSSTPEETDASPFITASGTYVRDGIIAANFLKIGTQVKIPALYGNKIFVVEDRMAPKNHNKVDIWMPSKTAALNFGVKKAEIVVLEN